MKRYGHMEGGYLRSRLIEPQEYKYTDSKGELHTRVISESEQIEELPHGWKPVDEIDNSKIGSHGDGFIVVPVPRDLGDHIGYDYIVKRDIKSVLLQIQALKDALAESDYKVIKCYEASLTGEPMPYDIAVLHSDRQKKRTKINELEALL